MKFSAKNRDNVDVRDSQGNKINFVKSFDTETLEAEILIVRDKLDGQRFSTYATIENGHIVNRALVAKVKVPGADVVDRKTGMSLFRHTVELTPKDPELQTPGLVMMVLDVMLAFILSFGAFYVGWLIAGMTS